MNTFEKLRRRREGINLALEHRSKRCAECPIPAPGAEKIPRQLIRDLGEMINKQESPTCPSRRPYDIPPGEKLCNGALEVQVLMATHEDQRSFESACESVATRARLMGRE